MWFVFTVVGFIDITHLCMPNALFVFVFLFFYLKLLPISMDEEVWPAVMSLPQTAANQHKQTAVSRFLPSVLASFLSCHQNNCSQVVRAAPACCSQLLTQSDRDGGWDMEKPGGGRWHQRDSVGFCVKIFHCGDRGPRWYNPIERLYKNLLPLTAIV